MRRSMVRSRVVGDANAEPQEAPMTTRDQKEPLSKEELLALSAEALDERELMSTLVVAPAPGVAPQLVGAVVEGGQS